MILLTDVGLFSHAMALIAYLGLAAATMWRQRALFNLLLGAAALLTAIWAGGFVYAVLVDPDFQSALSILQTVKLAGWIGLMLFMLRPEFLGGSRQGSAVWVTVVLGCVFVLQFALELSGRVDNHFSEPRDEVSSLFLVSRIAVAVTGVVLA